MQRFHSIWVHFQIPNTHIRAFLYWSRPGASYPGYIPRALLARAGSAGAVASAFSPQPFWRPPRGTRTQDAARSMLMESPRPLHPYTPAHQRDVRDFDPTPFTAFQRPIVALWKVHPEYPDPFWYSMDGIA